MYSYKYSNVGYSVLTLATSLFYTVHFVTPDIVLDMSTCIKLAIYKKHTNCVTRTTLLCSCNTTVELVPDVLTVLGYIIISVVQQLCNMSLTVLSSWFSVNMDMMTVLQLFLKYLAVMVHVSL